MTENPCVTIIIVTFNTKDLLLKCLDTIRETVKSLAYEVIVVDNASADGTQQALVDRCDNIRIIHNTSNLLYSKANNQGVALANGEYLLFLNSDAFLLPNSLEELVNVMSAKPNTAAVGPKIINPDKSLQSKGHPFPTNWHTFYCVSGLNKLPELIQKQLFPDYYWSENESRRVGWISGCCMLVRKAALRNIGGFWEKLFFYGEEVEWCVRAIRNGYDIWYAPNAQVVHLGGASTVGDAKLKINKLTNRLKSQVRLQEKVVGMKGAIVWASMVTMSVLIKIAICSIFKRSSLDYYSKALKWELITLRTYFHRYMHNKKRVSKAD